jgi:hypothetical protein
VSEPILNDKTFGELHDVYEGLYIPERLWQGSTSIKTFKEPLHIKIETTDALGITQSHRTAFEAFVQNQHEYERLALEALLEYYQTVILPLWRENDFFGAPELAPSVGEVADFERLLTFPRLYLSVRQGEVRVGLEFECTWDVEHGAGVLFRKGQVIRAGLAEVTSLHY